MVALPNPKIPIVESYIKYRQYPAIGVGRVTVIQPASIRTNDPLLIVDGRTVSAETAVTPCGLMYEVCMLGAVSRPPNVPPRVHVTLASGPPKVG